MILTTYSSFEEYQRQSQYILLRDEYDRDLESDYSDYENFDYNHDCSYEYFE